MNATEAIKILGIEKKYPISEETVKKHYREMAKKSHPDITGSDEQMKKINEAYDWLKTNLNKVNATNTQNKMQNEFTATDEMLMAFADYYIREHDIKKRQVAAELIMKQLENYQLNQKLSILRNAFKKAN
jgi:hypothetical protein